MNYLLEKTNFVQFKVVVQTGTLMWHRTGRY